MSLDTGLVSSYDAKRRTQFDKPSLDWRFIKMTNYLLNKVAHLGKEKHSNRVCSHGT